MTLLIEQAGAGDTDAVNRLFPVVFDELRGLAKACMAAERPGHTLAPTSLVNEAYLKLVGREDLRLAGRRAFFHAAAAAMRRILVDHARARGRDKRGGGWTRTPGNIEELATQAEPEMVEGLSRAFDDLEAESPEMTDVVRLRLFAGLSVEQTAELLGVSGPTVKRRWAYARAWLYGRIAASDDPDAPTKRSGRVP